MSPLEPPQKDKENTVKNNEFSTFVDQSIVKGAETDNKIAAKKSYMQIHQSKLKSRPPKP